PADGKPVLLKAGRYGAYVEHGQLRATLPAGTDTETLDLERATALLSEKAGKATPQGKSKSGAGQKDRKQTKQTKPAGVAEAPARKRAAKSSTRS
ncbi:MAG: topoisomerase C-terminal repeat-containing protein, partial [Rhodoplanes sp.]